MQRHTTRLIVAAVLIAAGAIGGFFVFDAHQRSTSLDYARVDVSARVLRLIITASEIGSAQQAYVAPGQPNQPWLERGAMLLQQFGEQTAELRPLLRSADARTALDGVVKNFKSLVSIDAQARQNLQEAQELLAADLIFSDGHDAVSAAINGLRATAASETAEGAAEQDALERQQLSIVGGVTAMWLLGLLLLARAPRVAIAQPVTHQGLLQAELRAPTTTTAPVAAASQPSSIDLASAADVCSALARSTDTTSLQKALAQAASVLDARGLIVWMGAGEELFPAMCHGYDARLVERFGPIARNAANATAEAWRTAQMRTVAGDVMANGAVAAPLISVDGCIGVFAAEVRNGRESDVATRAVAAMIAAQLAGLLSAWPGASATEVHKTA